VTPYFTYFTGGEDENVRRIQKNVLRSKNIFTVRAVQLAFPSVVLTSSFYPGKINVHAPRPLGGPHCTSDSHPCALAHTASPIIHGLDSSWSAF
jgi:hypothetical protein